MRNKSLLVYGLVIALGAMSGCASFGRGVTEAVLDRQTWIGKPRIPASAGSTDVNSMASNSCSTETTAAMPV
jgi:hypothetical protein